MNWSSSGSRGSWRPGGRASSFAAMAVSLSITSGGAPTCGESNEARHFIAKDYPPSY
jgi:hypothetical protein